MPPKSHRSNGRKPAVHNSAGRNNGARSLDPRPRRFVDLGLIVPDRIQTSMPYGEMIERAPAATTDLYTFRLNSTFDPDLTGTGHQPLGRDQLASVLYNRYRVLSAKAHVSFNSITSAGTPCLFYIYPTNGQSISVITDVLEQPNIKSKLAGDANYGFPLTLSGAWKLWDIWGKSKEEYLSDDTTGAVYSASPSEVINLDIGLGTADRTSTVTKWRFAIKIVYEVEWYDRVGIGPS